MSDTEKEFIHWMIKFENLRNGGNEFLSYSEIVGFVVNMREAKKNLNQYQFKYAYEIFQKLKKNYDTQYVDFYGYITMASDILVHFDMLVPVYKCCEDLEIMAKEENDKITYRIKAQELYDDGKFLTEEWMELHRVFKSTFIY